MSESTDKILASERPNNDEGWIEYALSLGWEELPMGYEYVTNNAAAELSALRAEVERLKEVKSKAAIVIAGWELMSKTSDYDLDELKEALRKYVNQ